MLAVSKKDFFFIGIGRYRLVHYVAVQFSIFTTLPDNMVKHWFLIFLGIGEAQSNLDVLGTRLVSEQLDLPTFCDGVTVLLNLVLSHAAATVQVQVFQV